MSKRLAKIAEAKQPKYLSMVKTPANRTGFRIIRSDEGDKTSEKTDHPSFTPKRTRRMDSKDGMLYIALPKDYTKEDAQQIMAQFGLEDDYEIDMNDDYVRLVRSDLGGELPDVATVAIRLDDNATAYVSESSFSNTIALRNEVKIGGAVLSGIEFEGHNEEFVKDFLGTKGISEENLERIDDETFYAPHKHTNTLRTDRVNIADGITARIYRADSNDIPESIQRGVVESAYGNYGYGQLDFYASLMDSMYTDAAYDAVYRLSDILRDITIYSGLNLSSRVDLMNNALSQYGFYMAELMNSLPRSVVSVMTSDISKTSDKEEPNMAGETKKENTTTEEAKRSDDVVIEKVEDTSTTEATTTDETEATRSDTEVEAKNDKTDEPKEEMLKRSDVQAMIDTAVTAAVKAVRADEPAKTDETEAKADETEDKAGDEAKRSDDAITKLTASVEALASKVEEMGDTSTVRYDNGSAVTDEKDVYSGSIFGVK